MLIDDLLRVIQADRDRDIAAAQRVRSARRAATAEERPGRRREPAAPGPSFGGRPHPGRPATDPAL